MVLTGAGQLGVKGTPTARLEFFQVSQAVETGLRFDDGTANQVWDIKHGFSLRFHYGDNLRGLINANTGAYEQRSDERLKSGVTILYPVLDKLTQLRPGTFYTPTPRSR